MKKKNKRKNIINESSPLSRMDDACYSHDPTEQFLRRRAYHETYLADIAGTEREERRIREESS